MPSAAPLLRREENPALVLQRVVVPAKYKKTQSYRFAKAKGQGGRTIGVRYKNGTKIRQVLQYSAAALVFVIFIIFLGLDDVKSVSEALTQSADALRRLT
jgi:hypothetical protein